MQPKKDSKQPVVEAQLQNYLYNAYLVISLRWQTRQQGITATVEERLIVPFQSARKISAIRCETTSDLILLATIFGHVSLASSLLLISINRWQLMPTHFKLSIQEGRKPLENQKTFNNFKFFEIMYWFTHKR
jgi:hypothetical protein